MKAYTNTFTWIMIVKNFVGKNVSGMIHNRFLNTIFEMKDCRLRFMKKTFEIVFGFFNSLSH